MNRIVSVIAQLSGWNALVGASKRWRFPGHRSISVYEVVSFLFMEMGRAAVMQRAASVAFSLFVSLFPTLLVAFTIIPFLPVKSFQTTAIITMQQVLPGDVFSLLRSTIEDIVNNHRADLLSISLVLAFYYSSRGVLSLMNSFDKALPGFRKRNFWQKQLVAFKIMGLLTILLVFSVVLIIGGQLLIHWIMAFLNAERVDLYVWLTLIRWIIIIGIYYLSISLIYFYGPAKQEPWKFFSVGSTFTTILLLLLSLLYSWFINQFGQYNKLYGSIGTLLVTQLWIYYNALGLLIGFELNASIEVNEGKTAIGNKGRIE